MDISKISEQINSLTIYGNIKHDKIIDILKDILTEQDNLSSLSLLVSRLTEMAEKSGFSGNLFKSYILHLMLRDENAFTLFCENNADVRDTSVYTLAKADIEKINQLADIDLSELPGSGLMDSAIKEITDYRPVNKGNAIDFCRNYSVDDVIAFHNKYGCGDISMYKSFRYNDKRKTLTGVAYPDPITFKDLIGYKAQIKQLTDNTLAFLKGYKANNVLLVGARGTGKSSSVKALVNEYFDMGLRIVEITKEQIAKLPDILKLIRHRGRKFIIFIDDLSFDESEIQYKYMKSLLEGGSEGQPDNVLFYATSNRRHIIQEKWSDRPSGSTDAEIHTQDTLNEKLSLSDRFGITISYPKPTPKEYIEIVKGIAKEQGLVMDEEQLKSAAMSWELKQKGMSGRTAKQFVNDMLWKISR